MSQDLQGKRSVRSCLHGKRSSQFETDLEILKITVLYNTKCLHSVLCHFTPSGIIIIIKNTQLSRKDRNTTKETKEERERLLQYYQNQFSAKEKERSMKSVLYMLIWRKGIDLTSE